MLETFFILINLNFLINLILYLCLSEKLVHLAAYMYTISNFALVIVCCILYSDFSMMQRKVFIFDILFTYNVAIAIGTDVVSTLFLVLTTFLFPVIIMAARLTIKYKRKPFYFIIGLLQYFIINFFISFDLLFFYIWFEASIIPMFLIIIVWGTKHVKVKAAFYMVMYTCVFSIPLLIAIIFIYLSYGTTNVYFLTYNTVFSPNFQKYLIAVFFCSFGSKLPVFPLHL